MKRKKIVSMLEYSMRNKMLVGLLAVSLIGAGGILISNQTNFLNNNITINKTLLAGTQNNDGNKACVINGNGDLVLFTSASDSNIAGYISVGQMLTINGNSNGYYNVTVQETGVTGYISSQDMQKITSGLKDPLTTLSGTGYITNVTTVVNLRESATMNSTILKELSNNTSVVLLGQQGNWYKVDYDGTTGYIYGEYIAIAKTDVATSNTTTNTSKTSSNVVATNNKVASNNKSSSSKTKVVSSNAKSGTTKKVASTTSKAESSSKVESSSKTTSSNNIISSNSESSPYAAYFGSWTINTSPFAEINNAVGDGTSEFPETIFLSKSEFIYGTQVVKDPVYKIVTENSADFLGSDQWCTKIFGSNDSSNVEVLLVENQEGDCDSMPLIVYNNKLLVSDGVCFYAYNLSNSSTTGIVGSSENVNCESPSSSSSETTSNNEANVNSTSKTTSSTISNSKLASMIRNWIITGQYTEQDEGTSIYEWAVPWINSVSNTTLVNTFKKANNVTTISGEITDSELNATTALLTKEVSEQPIKYTISQAKSMISEILTQDFTNKKLTNVVLKGDEYYAYINNSKTPFWYVNAKTGSITKA